MRASDCSTTVEGMPVDGLAYYGGDSGLPFRKLEVSLPKDQHALSSALLNTYLPAAPR